MKEWTGVLFYEGQVNNKLINVFQNNPLLINYKICLFLDSYGIGKKRRKELPIQDRNGLPYLGSSKRSRFIPPINELPEEELLVNVHPHLENKTSPLPKQHPSYWSLHHQQAEQHNGLSYLRTADQSSTISSVEHANIIAASSSTQQPLNDSTMFSQNSNNSIQSSTMPIQQEIAHVPDMVEPSYYNVSNNAVSVLLPSGETIPLTVFLQNQQNHAEVAEVTIDTTRVSQSLTEFVNPTGEITTSELTTIFSELDDIHFSQ